MGQQTSNTARQSCKLPKSSYKTRLNWFGSHFSAFCPQGLLSLKRPLCLFSYTDPSVKQEEARMGGDASGGAIRWAKHHSTQAELRWGVGGRSRMGSRQDLEQNESVLWGVWMSHAYTITHESESLIHESPWAEPHVARRVRVLSRRWEERLSRGRICQLAHLVSQVNDTVLWGWKKERAARQERNVKWRRAVPLRSSLLTLKNFRLVLFFHSKLLSKNPGGGNFPAVQWVRLYALTAKGLGLIPGQGTRLSQASWPKIFKNK